MNTIKNYIEKAFTINCEEMKYYLMGNKVVKVNFIRIMAKDVSNVFGIPTNEAITYIKEHVSTIIKKTF